jgi:UDP-N-acetylglucosamine--N-acetylmuramyl-(pentapeptide) pyrophosphoryl-undecaprenol N-acetylglucosamine transferase
MRYLLAGGGTAGHIEPALAVGRALLADDPDCSISFLGTPSGLETSLIPAAGFDLLLITKVKIARKLSPSLIAVPFQLMKAVSECIKALKGIDCAIGFGGYVSAPMYVASILTRTPLVIHEQNAHPGWANRIGAYFTSSIALSYPVARGALKQGEVTGLPLRSDVIAALESATINWSSARAAAKEVLIKRYRLDASAPMIFIFGGSQGSQAINAVVAQARQSFETHANVIHAVGKSNATPHQSARYIALNYIDEMALHYLAADLVIARSGAVTCAEVAALGKYALFIPLPVGNGEQALNAQSLVAGNRAEVLAQNEFTSEWLAQNISRLLTASSSKSDDGDNSGTQAADRVVSIIKRARGV